MKNENYTPEKCTDTENITAGAASEVTGNKPEKPKKTREERRKRRFWLRLAGFIAAMLIILTYALFVLTPKYIYGICSMYNYYSVPAGTVDVLAVGTSLTYTNLNTNILWNEYGIACYDLATAEQPFWSTYAYLKEALRVQKPKLVLLDIKAMTYLDDKVDRTRTVLCSYGILNPITRLQTIYECVEPEDFISFALGFPQVHTNYYKIKTSDFDVPPKYGNRGSSWKGYVEKDETAAHDTPNINFEFKTPNYVNEHEMEFFEKILQLCIDNDVEVILIGYPNADYKHDHLYYCKAFEIAEQYGITGINYNLPENRPPIDYQTECADWQHLNISGSVKFTRDLGEDLKEMYDLEDHRGDPAFASYDECAKLWFDRYPGYKTPLY
ncbi:MAG: QueT transporter family protein [Parasporobacterium sp.]|nr:QueT transporter family protein [Parasporobacterium sp.]